MLALSERGRKTGTEIERLKERAKVVLLWVASSGCEFMLGVYLVKGADIGSRKRR